MWRQGYLYLTRAPPTPRATPPPPRPGCDACHAGGGHGGARGVGDVPCTRRALAARVGVGCGSLPHVRKGDACRCYPDEQVFGVATDRFRPSRRLIGMTGDTLDPMPAAPYAAPSGVARTRGGEAQRSPRAHAGGAGRGFNPQPSLPIRADWSEGYRGGSTECSSGGST
jgi:hypothetical protein